MSFKQISVDETKHLIEAEDITILDIRDAQSYSKGHISNAIHAEGINFESFIIKEDMYDILKKQGMTSIEAFEDWDVLYETQDSSVEVL